MEEIQTKELQTHSIQIQYETIDGLFIHLPDSEIGLSLRNGDLFTGNNLIKRLKNSTLYLEIEADPAVVPLLVMLHAVTFYSYDSHKKDFKNEKLSSLYNDYVNELIYIATTLNLESLIWKNAGKNIQ